MKLKSIYLDKPGGYYKKDKYRPHIIEEQFYSVKIKDSDEAEILLDELTLAAGRKIFGFHYDSLWGGIYFSGRTKFDVIEYNTDEETKFFFDFLAISSPFENPGTPLSLEFYNKLFDIFYDSDYQYLNEHNIFFMFENNQFEGKTFSLNYLDDVNPLQIEVSWYSDHDDSEEFDDDDDDDDV
jgi:hypothetical protein